MSDIKRYDRKFTVWVPGSEETVEVEAGSDADEVCKDVLDTMLGNMDSGWSELDGDDSEEDC